MSEAVFPDDIIEAQEKRIAELEGLLRRFSQGYQFQKYPILELSELMDEADKALSEGGADEE